MKKEELKKLKTKSILALIQIIFYFFLMACSWIFFPNTIASWLLSGAALLSFINIIHLIVKKIVIEARERVDEME